jgi:hypothetical protein
MNQEFAPMGNASEKLLAITLGSSNPVRDLSGRELRRAAARAARKTSKGKPKQDKNY